MILDYWIPGFKYTQFHLYLLQIFYKILLQDFITDFITRFYYTNLFFGYYFI